MKKTAANVRATAHCEVLLESGGFPQQISGQIGTLLLYWGGLLIVPPNLAASKPASFRCSIKTQGD